MLDFSTLVPAGLHNPRVRQYLAMKKIGHPYAENLVCIEGLRMLTLARKAGLEIDCFFVCSDLLRGDASRSIVSATVAMGVPSFLLSEKAFCSITEWDGPDGLAAIVKLPQFDCQAITLRQHNALLVLDGLQIPGNIGTIIRCADGAGADGILLINKRQRLTHPKLVRASMGSLFSFPVVEIGAQEAILWLQRHAFKIVTTDCGASLSYRNASYAGRVAVVLGNEHCGISPEWYEAQHMSVSIPMHGRADSLNVGNAAVLILYEMLHQQERMKRS